MPPEICDFLVVGGGAAGCIVARRLAEGGSGRVILLEAGPSDEGDPLATLLSRLEDQDDSYDWGYEARPVDGGSATINYARARMLGGCANHNDCAFIAPPASDLDDWVLRGATGWDARAMAPYLRRVEETIHIEASPPGNALSRAFIDAGLELGLPERNFREETSPGTGWFPLNARGDLRQSSSIAYLHPLSGLPKNLEVRTGVTATRLVIENGRCRGVETAQGPIHAAREVILTAGSINTPHLMMLSGLGPAGHLRATGIEVVADLPGVGQNLIDHVSANIACELKAPPPAWARTPCEATALVRIDADAPAPDVLFHFVLRLREKYAGMNQFAGVAHGVKLSPNVARPKSRGRLMLQGPDPKTKPLIELNYFSDAQGYDQRILTEGLRFARRLTRTGALAPWLAREVAPGPEVQSDDELFAYMKQTCETVYHPSGTCVMGDPAAAMTVVGPDLRVRGVEGLRVADASVFPAMVTVNICNTVMMVAERAADLILRA